MHQLGSFVLSFLFIFSNLISFFLKPIKMARLSITLSILYKYLLLILILHFLVMLELYTLHQDVAALPLEAEFII